MIMDLEDNLNVDLTKKFQHGFKRKKSTNAAGLIVQSLIARAVQFQF